MCGCPHTSSKSPVRHVASTTRVRPWQRLTMVCLREVPAYKGHEQYDANVLAVSDGGVITASHLGSVEFAREIIHTLDLYSASDRHHWYRLFKHAIPPPWFAGEPTEIIRAA
jgi:hypothetical protein